MLLKLSCLPSLEGEKFSTVLLSIIHALIPGLWWMAIFGLDMYQGAVNMTNSSQCTLLRYNGIRVPQAKATLVRHCRRPLRPSHWQGPAAPKGLGVRRH
jgi:hypothetical protein